MLYKLYALHKIFPENRFLETLFLVIAGLAGLVLMYDGFYVFASTLYDVTFVQPWKSPFHLLLNIVIAILRGFTCGWIPIRLV